MIEKRSIGLCVLLSFLTCGIYVIYWYYMLLKELYYANNLPNNAAVDVLLSLVTCGIYQIYMFYQMGKMINSGRQSLGLPDKDDSILFLVLGLLGLGIIDLAIIQSELNDTIGPAIANMQVQYVMSDSPYPPNM